MGGVVGVVRFFVIVQALLGLSMLAQVLLGLGAWIHLVAGAVMFVLLRKDAAQPRSLLTVVKFALSFFMMLALAQLLWPFASVFAGVIGMLAFFFLCRHWVFRPHSVPELFRHPLFLFGLLVKIIVAGLFATDYLAKGVLPMVEFFVRSGLQDPYQAFAGTSVLVQAHPLSPLLLFLLAIPFSLSLQFGGELFLLKVPLLLADIGVLFMLHKLLRTEGKSLLIYYWWSPIILYVTYMQGQLDLIPICLLMLAIMALVKGRQWLGVLLLGIGGSVKAIILIAVPFVFLYLWRRRTSSLRLVAYAALIAIISYVGVLPYASSEGFQEMLSLSRLQATEFLLSTSLSLGSLTIYLVPLLLILFALRLTYYRIMTRDVLLMSLALAFIILVVLVPPLSGWFLWSLPFIVYFFLKEESVSRKHLLIFTGAFFLYFAVFSASSEIFNIFQPISAWIAALPPPIMLLAPYLPTSLLTDLSFTALAGAMIINAVWVYKHGILTRYESMRMFFIGIAGDSGTGKTSLGVLLEKALGKRNITELEGDDLHRWERHDTEWKKITHLDPRANRLHEELRTAKSITKRRIKRARYDHSTGSFAQEKTVEGGRFVILSGLHTLYLSEMREQLDLKVFMNPHPDVQLHWKVARDVGERGYTKAQVRGQVKQRKKDRERHILSQEQFADIVISLQPVRAMTRAQVWNTTYKPRLRLVVRMSNSVNLDPVLTALQDTKLKVRREFDADLRTQEVSIQGTLNKETITELAYALVPDAEAITEPRPLSFEDGYDGLIQLLMIYMINERMTG